MPSLNLGFMALGGTWPITFIHNIYIVFVALSIDKVLNPKGVIQIGVLICDS